MCMSSSFLFSQKKYNPNAVFGLKFGYVNHFYEKHQNPISPSFGFFGQFNFQRDYALETSFTYQQYFYRFEKTNTRVPLPSPFFSISLREQSYSIKAMNKFYLSHKKISSYIGVGGLVNFPLDIKVNQTNLLNNATTDFTIEKIELENSYAVTLAFGFDYFTKKRLFISTQFGFNYFSNAHFSSFLNERYSPKVTNLDIQNIYAEVSIGYIIK